MINTHCSLLYFISIQDQFEQHIRADVTLKVYLYYGAERNRSVKHLSEQDVVLTTYNVLSSDFGVSGFKADAVAATECLSRW